MSKALRIVGTIAGAVAITATGIGAFAGAAALAATAAKVANIATVVAGVANVGSTLLQKKPRARGSVSQIIVGSDPPTPYIMGRSYFGGVLRHDTAYGGKVKKVHNPYRGMVIVYSGCGPVEQLVSPQVDFKSDIGWYSGFLHTSSQLGQTPEPSALSPNWPGMPGWGAGHKLSGQAAILWSLKFDKDAERFASGVPVLGAVWKGVKVYDPRKDSTHPGGSGSQRIDNEATWTWSENPALHALAYAYGRYQNGQHVFGVGLPATAIDIPAFVALANVCDANGWTVSGVIFEPGNKWENLKDILAAGAADPAFSGGRLSLRIRAPMVELDTITQDDIADEDCSVTAMQSYRDRLNTITPKYRSEEHNWELVPAEKVQAANYLAEDGEEKAEEVTFNLVRDVDQAAQLAHYRLVDGRELGPIRLVCTPRLRAYRPGECLRLDLPELGLDTPAIIITRQIDPATMKVTFTLVSETVGKHEYALGLTGTPPPTPAIGMTAQDRDEAAAALGKEIPQATDLSADAGMIEGEANLTWRNSEHPGWAYVLIHHATTDDIMASTAEPAQLVGGLGEIMAASVSGLTPVGTHYFWIVAYTADGVPFEPSEPDSAEVT